ncbi:MAG TPA: SMI1/KNR4 family protein [Kofleriaceae bacterium]|nr:SMI1/KNR4 family protein [Kofleriaceae bacterium]
MTISPLWAALDTYSPTLRASFATAGATLASQAPGMDLAVALYAVADGQLGTEQSPFPPSVYDNYYWMPLAEVDEVRQDLDGMAKVGEWDDERTRVINWWVPGWLPLLTDGNSNYICIDTVGSFGGAPGQLIEFIHDDDERLVLAPNFDAWFAAWVAALDAKHFAVEKDTDEDPPFISLRAKSTLKKFLAARLEGYPKRHKATKEKIAAPKAAKAPKAKAAQLLAVFKERMSVSDVAAALAAGAAINVQDKDGNTPLHLAMEFGNDSVPAALIAAGADVHARNRHGYAPIHLAVLAKPRAAPLLIAALAKGGADLNAPSPSGKPPILSALHVEAAQALIAGGVERASFASYPATAWLDASVAQAMLNEG